MAEDNGRSGLGTRNVKKRIEPGGMIKPWLMLGPFHRDVSDSEQGLTLFERDGSRVGRATLNMMLEEAETILSSEPVEGAEEGFLGESGSWHLVRRPEGEKYLYWGRFYTSNHASSGFLSTTVTPEQAGPAGFRLTLLKPVLARVLVALNGRVVFDTEMPPVSPPPSGKIDYRFSGELDEGANVLTVGMFRVGRWTQLGFRLDTMEQALTAQIPLRQGLTPEMRAGIEDEAFAFRVERDIFYPEHPVRVSLGADRTPGTSLHVRVVSRDGETMAEEAPAEAGCVDLCPGGALDDGNYRLICRWDDGEGRPVTSIEHGISRLTPTSALVGYGRLEERKQMALAHYAAQQKVEDAAARPDIWTTVARYALGRYDEVDEEAILRTCDYVAARRDCSDFLTLCLLRLACWERDEMRLSPAANAYIRDALLGFKYWIDEPGDTVMYFGSENHRLCFHISEYLAAQLYPLEEFSNSRQRGLFHASKARTLIAEWLRQRGQFGFDEWHSNVYYPIDVLALINLYDFLPREEYKLEQQTKAVLDYIFFQLAADSFHGVHGTAHARTSTDCLKYPESEGTAPLCWLLFGEGNLSGGNGMAAACVASSRYRLPRILAEIAEDRSAVAASRQRQGILERSYVGGEEQSANLVVYRTPDYMLSGLQDYRKGEFDGNGSVAQVTLGNRAAIFWSCPYTSSEGGAMRPDYWAGNITLPRVIQYQNVLSLTWKLSEFAWMSHCFFPADRFDESRVEKTWAFARVADGYVGICSQHGLELAETGRYAGREICCSARENTWIVECGRQDDWGDFERFVSALKDVRIEQDGEVLVYRSPSVGEFRTGWEVRPTVDGQPVETRGYPLVDSPWAQAAYGSGEMVIRYGDQRQELWFNQV